MTSWLELVELTMEGSCLPELQPCLPNRALVTALQARPLPPLLPWGSLWPHVCQMAILSGCGGSFQDPWWLTFGWLAAVLQNSRDCWGLLGGAQAPPPTGLSRSTRMTFGAVKWWVVCFRGQRVGWGALVTSQVCLARITCPPRSLRVALLSRPSLRAHRVPGL